MQARNILLIDDNEIDNFITKQILQKSGVAENIFVQSSGADALNFLEEISAHPERMPDYIFLDILMPAMDGFDFLDQYAKLPEAIRKHCIIYILSSSNAPKDMVRAAKIPYVKKYLKKPLDENMLQRL